MEALPVALLLLLLLSSVTLVVSDFCVCKTDQPQAALQKTIDYACGAGADCNYIHEQGPCYNPNTVVAHCSWAANSYFQKNRAVGATCDFTGTAVLTTSDPSSSGCSYPASASAAGTSTGTGTGTGIGTGTGTGGTTGTFTPVAGTGTTTGSTGTGLGGLSPMGTSSMDTAATGLHPKAAGPAAAFLAVILCFLTFA